MSRTRPCLYCGKTFFDKIELQRHEHAEAMEFEREAMHFENENKIKNQSMFENHDPTTHQVIDRTDEEFGDENFFPENLKIYTKDSTDYVTNVPTRTVSNHICNNVNIMNSATQPSSLSKPQYNNHTSQYTSFDPVCPSLPGPSSANPPPAHEDPTTQHGFFPPPPPLPVPQFSQVCHKRSDVEFPDPNEDKTYTRLQSKDESHTRSSLLHVNSMSPNREVLDLSLPKNDIEVKHVNEENQAKIEFVEETRVENHYQSQELDCTFKPDSSIPKEESSKSFEESVVKEKEESYKEEMISFEPSSMPSMPEANISYPESRSTIPVDQEETANIEADWKSLSDEYSGLINPDDDVESLRSQSPHQFDDPNRIDCKFCGMIFNAPHVRKFHEKSHDEEHEEYDGELTRLFCGFCGKTFKKATYRMLHEKGHTGELTICCQFCDRRFRWESELKSHNKLCTADHPAKPLSRKLKPQSSNRHAEKDDWVENHPSMPTGWKLRTRPRPTQEGQLYFIFLSPEGQVFHSRKSVLQHMEKTFDDII